MNDTIKPMRGGDFEVSQFMPLGGIEPIKRRSINDATPAEWTAASVKATATAPAIARQEGGAHYKGMSIQPVQFIHANGIGFLEGSAIKYLSRWKVKGGIEDLRKARHFIDLLIEMEGAA